MGHSRSGGYAHHYLSGLLRMKGERHYTGVAQGFWTWIRGKMTVLASWFVAQTKFEWAQEHPRDPKLLQELEVDVLSALSMANIRTLLRAVMPLKQLTVSQATEQVADVLFNRARSKNINIKNQ